jgi:hypothetical protein
MPAANSGTALSPIHREPALDRSKQTPFVALAMVIVANFNQRSVRQQKYRLS